MNREELKVYKVYTTRNEGAFGFCEGADHTDIELEHESVCLKSDVDKVIAELKADIANLRDDKKSTDAILDERNAEVAKLQAIIEERDKTIEGLQADYKEACDRLQTANLIKDEQLAATRHQKYKRCLSMAQKWRNYSAFCGMQSSCHNHRGFGKTAEKWTWKECHAWRCFKRWLELAEKYREAK